MKASRCAWKSISLYNVYVSTIFYSIISFTYPVIRLHVSTVCQSSSGLIHYFLPYAFCPLWDPIVFTFFLNMCYLKFHIIYNYKVFLQVVFIH